MSRARNLRKRYSMTEEEYDKLYHKQGARCAVCNTKHDNLHVDHDHSTGKVRGLLCHHCNSGLGFFKDHIITIFKSILYLTRTKIIPQIKNFLF